MFSASRFRTTTLLVGVFSLLAFLQQPNAAFAGEEVGSQCDATEHGFTCLIGPVEVDYGHHDIFQYIAAPPVPGFITYARAVAVNENGRRLPRHVVHLHHSLFYNTLESSPTCWGPEEGFYGTGKEHTKMLLPDGLGYYWSNQSEDGAQLDESARPWLLDAELQGMHRGVEETAYIRLNLHIEPADAALTAVQPLWWAVKGCVPDTSFDVAKGSGRRGRFKISYLHTMPADGRFVFGWGHLHDGGIKLVLRNVSDHRLILTSRALYESAERWDLTGTTSFSSATGVAADEGDVLRLTAVYDSTHAWRDVMGNLRSFIVPD